MGMIYILKNVGKNPDGQFYFCMVVLVQVLRRHIAAFLTQIDFTVFYLISVGLVNLVLLRR